VQSTIPQFALRACLRCDFSVRLEANGYLRAHFPALASPWSRGPSSRRFAERVLNSLPKVIQDGSARRPEGDPAQRGGSAPEQPFDSDRKAKSQHRHARSAIGGQCRCTAPCRARGLAQRGEAQGGRGGVWRSAHHPTCIHAISLSSFFFFLKIKK
jgi:hypothetical protein